ncbi:DeoR/GlpR family DNA-binding transcription regulator [Flagellimonas myxillae]|uniref:DeoR/GlpR family DNA-binding transcription regulator n=1 Tax=Flagellimonas myxillae TaxID=2942214 RepID=UPI00201EAC48|nr:DeoR/GlpR family DNA-binding transcription regulator [Muricauda myxillae]MCL6268074.1 DeoR/GlpR family DNA-binding transcription regulator [Muricauda myxillae]
MQKDKRQDSILEKLQLGGKVSTQQLADELLVSEDTIRRDLNEMAQKGLLAKVHGGAVSSIQKLYYYNDNVVKNQQEKNLIAKKAIPLIKDGMTMIISDGTTNLAFARAIPKDLRATVFTYCLPIAMELTDHPLIEIILLGGKIHKKSMVAVGADVVERCSNLHVDMCFLGTGSIGHEEGITEGSYDVSLIKRAVVSASDKVISLTTSGKLGLKQAFTICKPKQIDVLVTELNPKDTKLSPYKDLGIHLI